MPYDTESRLDNTVTIPPINIVRYVVTIMPTIICLCVNLRFITANLIFKYIIRTVTCLVCKCYTRCYARCAAAVQKAELSGRVPSPTPVDPAVRIRRIPDNNRKTAWGLVKKN